MIYKIKQIADMPRSLYRFMDYDFAVTNGFNLNDYATIYEGEIDGETPEQALEKLFYIFNMQYPKDFRGHSLSVSDVVELDGVNYYCDNLGWKKLS